MLKLQQQIICLNNNNNKYISFGIFLCNIKYFSVCQIKLIFSSNFKWHDARNGII